LFNSQTVTPAPPPPPRQPSGGPRIGRNRGPPPHNHGPAANGRPQRRRSQSRQPPAGNFNHNGPPTSRNFNQNGPPTPRNINRQGPPPTRDFQYQGPPIDLYRDAPPPFNQPGGQPLGPYHQQGPAPPGPYHQQGPPPPGPFNQHGPPPPGNFNNQGPPPEPYQQGPNNGPTPPAATKPKPPASKSPSIAVERLKNIQRRIDNLLKSQGAGASAATTKQLAALRQIRDILSGKNLKGSSGPKPVPQGPNAQTKPGGPPVPASPPYKTTAGAPRSARSLSQDTPPYNAAAGPGNNNNAYPPVNISPFVSASGPMSQAGPGPAPGQQGRPWPGPAQQQVNVAPPKRGRGKKRGPAVTTVAPKLGDVRMVGTQRFVYTDADGFDTFQWVKATPGPPAEQPAQPPAKNPKQKPQPKQTQQ